MAEDKDIIKEQEEALSMDEEGGPKIFGRVVLEQDIQQHGKQGNGELGRSD